MCGRYLISPEEDQEFREIINEINESFKDKAAYNTGEIFPTNTVPVITSHENKRNINLFKWGFPQYKGSGVIINARCETLGEKPTFRGLLFSKRCIIPASGFYEWKPVETRKKEKYLIRLKEKNIFYMAGLYNTFVDANNAPYGAFVIITTNANNAMAGIHDRMPVILEPGMENTWLKIGGGAEDLHNILKPYDSNKICLESVG